MPRKKKVVIESSDEESQSLDSPLKGPQTPKGGIEAAFARVITRNGAGNAASPSKSSHKTSLPVRKAVVAPRNQKSKTSSAANSPAKGAANGNKIFSFFNNATQKQAGRRPQSPEKGKSQSLEVEDDMIYDSSEAEQGSTSTTNTLIKGTKRKFALGDEPYDSSASNRAPKFLRTSGATTAESLQNKSVKMVDQRPWADQFAPVSLDELAVHKRKVQDVQDWLTKTVSGRHRQRLLVLKGGAGSGKTTTIRLLSQSLGLKLNEWTNPGTAGGPEGAGSLASRFEDFVSRISLYGSLSFVDSRKRSNTTSKDPATTTNEEGSQIILLEEFPNTYSQGSSTVQGFRSAVIQYLTTSTPSSDDFFSQRAARGPIVPVVMIVSESLLTTSTASADSFTAHRLLGTEILNHIGTTVIEFNPIAPTFMSKALELILKKEARRSGRRFAPGPSVLRHLSDIGDVRSAVSALEFFCLHQGEEADWSGKIQFTKSKKSSTEAAPTTKERQSLELITQRENTLGIFHAVGKVVYNKRETPTATDSPPPQPVPWLPQHHREKISTVNVDTLLNELGTDISVFTLALHENFVLSCQGLEAEDTLDSINGCLDSLSDADLLSPDRFANNQSRFTFQGTTTDSLRQDEIGFDTGVRGILFNLPHPVKRAAPPSDYAAGRGKQGKGSTGFQMLYPTSLRLWRKQEQIEGLVELFNEKFRTGHFEDDVQPRSMTQKSAQGVMSWRKNGFLGSTAAASQTANVQAPESSSLLRGASKNELLLERLPYVVKIDRRKPQSIRSGLSKQLDRVVCFSGLTNILTGEDEEPADDAPAAETWSTDKPGEQSPQRRRGPALMIKKSDKTPRDVQEDVEKLVLSDDDIEDD